MRVNIQGDETREELELALRNVSASHAKATNPHLRRMLLAEADELMDALAAHTGGNHEPPEPHRH